MEMPQTEKPRTADGGTSPARDVFVRREPDRGADMLILLICLAIMALSLILNLSGDETVSLTADGSHPLPPICVLRATTGLRCPGCGLTRSFIAMAHLDLGAAWHQHHVGPLLFLFGLLQIPYRSLRLIWPSFAARSERHDLRVNSWVLLGIVGLMTVNWIIYLIVLLS